MLYQNMREEFGTNLITTPDHKQDTYIRSEGDVGINQAGPAVWPHNVEDFLRQRLTPAQ
jgi:hypothetical protein